MRCPYCGQNNDRVIDSRTSGDACVIRRRRECLQCGRRYTTYEKFEPPRLLVVKKDGRRDRFDRDKILSGLLKACEKRPVSVESLEEIVRRIEREVQESFDREVSSKYIGQLVMDALREIDHVAYVRFASVYREFKDVEEFLQTLKPLLNGGEAEDAGPGGEE